MSLSKSINWSLSALGLFCVSMSLVFLFSTTVYASCSAVATGCAAGGASRCNCSSGGSCNSGAGWVSCNCNNPAESSSGTCELIIQ